MPSKNTLKNLRKQAAEQQGWRCFYCRLPMWETHSQGFIVHYGLSAGLAKRFRCTAEHVDARSDGGKDVASNIVAACLFCNTTRHKAKHPVDAAKHAAIVRSRLEKGRWHPAQAIAAFSKRMTPSI
jgi:hypothetical protein